MSTMDTLVQIKNLSKTYESIDGKVNAIKDVTFDIYKNEFLTIIGSSGCGKSTILNILDQLDKEYQGTIEFNEDINIGYMLQEDALFEWLTVEENALLGLKILKKLNDETRKYTISLLDKYGLKDFKDKYPKSLSGGMRQRVALIRTLATKPKILLMDEPFSALDYQTRLQVSDDVYRIIKQEGMTVVMVSHDLAESISVSDRIIVLSKRPATIKNIYKIELSNKSTPIENRKAKEFAYYYDILWKDLDKNV